MSSAFTQVSTREELSGQRIADRYQLLNVVGRGGLGTVYRATDERLNRTVAVKVLLPRFSSDPRFGVMLRDEARITASLDHPGIVRIYDFGDKSGQVYMVTELIAGRSLKQILSVRQPLPLQYSIPIVHKIAAALSYAHSMSVIHLDVKPSNILIGDDGRVLLSDFGLALAAGQSIAERGFVAGTLAYMSPEQASGKQLDLRSDVYSLGVTFYELLAGTRPFAHDPTRFDRIRSAARMRVLRPLGHEVPEKLTGLVMTALCEDPNGRFASMDAFLAALRGATDVPETVTTARTILEACAIASPEDDTGVYDSEKVQPQELVFASYRVTGGPAESVENQAAPEPLVEEPVAVTLPEPAPEIPSARYARELLVQCPDGQMKVVPLTGARRLSVGRSSAAELCFPEDAGLSRQHFAFEPEGDDWTVQDLGSKNGTFVNNIPLKVRLILKPGDRVTAGHLAIVFSPAGDDVGRDVVVFREDDRAEATTGVVFSTNLEDELFNKPVFERAQKASAPMQALIRAGQELSENHTLNELFVVTLDMAIQAVNAQRGVLMILEGDQLVPRAHRGDGFRISTAVRDRVMRDRASILVRDAQLDDAFKSRMSVVEQKVHTLMAVPLQTKDRIVGLIYLDSPFILREFTKDDLSLLTVMANMAAIRIENARLAEVEQAERIMARDLAQAADIQGRMLPEAVPKVAGLDLAGYNSPCRTVGGDYYDFFTYADGRVALLVADVSGKGIPASLMMTRLSAHVQSVMDEPRDLGATMVQINKLTCARAPANRFITLFLGRIDPASGELVYANAGHNPPILVRASGEAQFLEGGGPVLGILPIAPYREERLHLDEGDMLVLYSDGVTEAGNPQYDEFGEERLMAILQRHRTEPAAAVVAAVTKGLAEFAAGTPQADDITLVVARLERLKPGGRETVPAGANGR